MWVGVLMCSDVLLFYRINLTPLISPTMRSAGWMDFLCWLGWNLCCLATTEYGEWRFVEGISCDVIYVTHWQSHSWRPRGKPPSASDTSASQQQHWRTGKMHRGLCRGLCVLYNASWPYMHACMQGDLDPLASLHNLTYLRYIFFSLGVSCQNYQIVLFL